MSHTSTLLQEFDRQWEFWKKLKIEKKLSSHFGRTVWQTLISPLRKRLLDVPEFPVTKGSIPLLLSFPFTILPLQDQLDLLGVTMEEHAGHALHLQMQKAALQRNNDNTSPAPFIPSALVNVKFLSCEWATIQAMSKHTSNERFSLFRLEDAFALRVGAFFVTRADNVILPAVMIDNRYCAVLYETSCTAPLMLGETAVSHSHPSGRIPHYQWRIQDSTGLQELELTSETERMPRVEADAIA